MQIVDARGLECPKPVIKAKEALDGGAVKLKILVDNEVAASNVTRFLKGRGLDIKREGEAPNITVEGEKNDVGVKTAAPEAKAASWSLLLLSDKIGADSAGLGDVLMKAFLGTIVKGATLPDAVALMNDGVKMALEERSTCDTLRELEQAGVPLLICGTCVKHFNITDKVKIGVISNMFEITDTVFSCSKPLVIG